MLPATTLLTIARPPPSWMWTPPPIAKRPLGGATADRLPVTVLFFNVSVPTRALQIPPPWESLATGPPASFSLMVVRSSVSFPQFAMPPPSPRAKPHGPPGHGGPIGAATRGRRAIARDQRVGDRDRRASRAAWRRRDEDAAADDERRVARVDPVPDRDAGDRHGRRARGARAGDREDRAAAADDGRVCAGAPELDALADHDAAGVRPACDRDAVSVNRRVDGGLDRRVAAMAPADAEPAQRAYVRPRIQPVLRRSRASRRRSERSSSDLSFQGSTQTVSMTRSQGMPASLARLLDHLTRRCVEEAENELVADEVERATEGRASRGIGSTDGESKLVFGHAGPEALGRVQHRGQWSADCCPKPVPNASRPLGKGARALETSLHGSEPSRVPASGPAHRDRRRRADRRGRPEAACAARSAPAQREPCRLARAPDRGALRRAGRELGRSRAAQPRLAPAQGPEPGRPEASRGSPRGPAATCSGSSRASSISTGSRCWSRRAVRRSRPATRPQPPARCARRRRCGTDGRSRISSSSGSSGSRPSGSTSSASPRSRSGSTPSSRSAGICRSSPSSNASAPTTRSASASGRS